MKRDLLSKFQTQGNPEDTYSLETTVHDGFSKTSVAELQYFYAAPALCKESIPTLANPASTLKSFFL
jgi:hypothetical protein